MASNSKICINFQIKHETSKKALTVGKIQTASRFIRRDFQNEIWDVGCVRWAARPELKGGPVWNWSRIPTRNDLRNTGIWPATGTLFLGFGKLSRRPGTPSYSKYRPTWVRVGALFSDHTHVLWMSPSSLLPSLCAPFLSPLPLCRAAGGSIANTCSFDAIYQTHRGRLFRVLNSNSAGVPVAAHISGDLWVLKVTGWNPWKS